MSAQEGHLTEPSQTHHEARVQHLERVLCHYGALTRERLYELSGAEQWGAHEPFDSVLQAALAAGRVRSLGGVLLEATECRAPGPFPPISLRAAGRR